MKFSFVENRATTIIDTQKFKTYEEWVDLLGRLGRDIVEFDFKIERAKDKRIRFNRMMPGDQWKTLHNNRYSRLKQWRTVANNLILLYPDRINFAANQFMRIVREEHEEVFKDTWPRAAVEPTKVLVSKEGKVLNE